MKKNKKKKILSFIGLVLGMSIFLFTDTYAKKSLSDAPGFLSQVSTGAGIEQTEVSTVIGKTISTVLQVTGIIFFLLMILAGFMWMFSRGNEEAATKARKIIVGSIIGIIIVVSAYAITNLITRSIIERQREGAGALEGGYVPGVGQTGCCMDKVGTGSFDIGVWACRIDTQEGCERRANTPETGDTITGPGTWEWHSGVELEACLQMCTGKQTTLEEDAFDF